jgi:RNA polymerase-binding transcription factor DksA
MSERKDAIQIISELKAELSALRGELERVKGALALEPERVFHVAWGNAKKAPNYDKEAWKYVLPHVRLAALSRPEQAEKEVVDQRYRYCCVCGKDLDATKVGEKSYSCRENGIPKTWCERCYPGGSKPAEKEGGK